MDASVYRAEYAAYSRDLEIERHRLYVAWHDDSVATAAAEFARVEERYSDLHRLEAATEIQQALDATPAQIETERTPFSTN